MTDVHRDAGDLPGVVVPVDPPADGVLAGKRALREGLAHDQHARRAHAVGRGDAAAPQHRHAHHLEVLRADHEEVGHRPARRRLVLHAHAAIAVSPRSRRERDEHGVRRAGDAGQRPRRVAQQILEGDSAGRAASRLCGDRGADGDDVGGIEARGRGREAHERPQQQDAADEEDHRDGDLGRDEERGHAAVAPGEAAPRIGAQAGAGARVAQPARARKPGEQRRGERARGGDREHARVDPHVGGQRQRFRIDRDEREGERPRDRDPEQPGDREERQAFGPQLPREPSGRGADGGADPELEAARVRLRQQQVGDVRAGDGQEHRDRSGEQQHHRLDRPDHRVLQAVERHLPHPVGVRVGGREPRADGRDFVLRRRHRRIGAQPSDRRRARSSRAG